MYNAAIECIYGFDSSNLKIEESTISYSGANARITMKGKLYKGRQFIEDISWTFTVNGIG